MKYQTKGEEKKPLVVRLHVGLKKRLDIASGQQGISQSRLAVDLISEGLNKSISLDSILDHVGVISDNDADKTDIETWLNRI